MRESGLTYREIGEKFGFIKEQVKEFFSRYHQKQRKLTAGIAIRKKGRPAKECVVREEDKVAELRYALA